MHNRKPSNFTANWIQKGPHKKKSLNFNDASESLSNFAKIQNNFAEKNLKYYQSKLFYNKQCIQNISKYKNYFKEYFYQQLKNLEIIWFQFLSWYSEV